MGCGGSAIPPRRREGGGEGQFIHTYFPRHNSPVIVDIFTHAVAILVVLYATGNPVLIAFGVLGGVIIDTDMAWVAIARSDPSLYLFHHAGFSHSFFGATVLSAIAFGTTIALASALLSGFS